MINIFLDDYRDPEYFRSIPFYKREWTVVRNYDEFVKLVEQNVNNIGAISFDHDLSEEHYQQFSEGVRPENVTGAKTGYDCVRWIEEKIVKGEMEPPHEMVVHSMNPSGAQRIQLAIRAIYEKC